jgi:hypothetical protein
MTVDMSDYVEVHERIEKFYAKHPEGSLQSSWQLLELDDQTCIVVEARAFRSPDDPRPGVGLASEPVPGLTPYTKNSELMNAETSAWGRAIAALGFEVKRGIASANEVRSRESSNGSGSGAWKMSDKQRGFFERLLKEKGVAGEDLALVLDWGTTVLTGGKTGTASTAIDGLMDDTEATVERLTTAARAWAEKQAASENVDDSDLPPVPVDDQGTVI